MLSLFRDLVNLKVQGGGIKLMISAAIGLDVKTPVVFMPLDTENGNNGLTARSYLDTLKRSI